MNRVINTCCHQYLLSPVVGCYADKSRACFCVCETPVGREPYAGT